MILKCINSLFISPYSTKPYNLFHSMKNFRHPKKSLKLIHIKFNHLKFNMMFFSTIFILYFIGSYALHDHLVNVSPHMLIILTIIEMSTVLVIYMMIKKILFHLAMTHFHQYYWNKRFPNIKMNPININLGIKSLDLIEKPEQTEMCFHAAYAEHGE